ncbi:MAG: hypothetical protein M1822_001228 [Bathelium mastoideum]|nr:MAG: hypothetical protein M1822_001228 [Bathelium mastoideum]
MLVGKCYALYDAKWVFITSTVIFMTGSALCGGAPNMSAEIVGRVIAGAGGNAMYFGLLNLMSVNTLAHERPLYLGLTGGIWGVGTILGPVVGGAFELYTWRWAYYVNLLFAVLLLPAYVVFIPSCNPQAGSGLTVLQRARSIDWIGALLSVAGFVLIIVPINFGGTLFAWGSGAIISLFVVDGAVWIAFAIQQTFCIFTSVENRMFPVHLLKYKEAILLFILGCCGVTITYVGVYYIPLYFQFTRGATAIQTAKFMLPFIIILVFTMVSTGALMGKTGYYKPWYVIGSAIALVGCVLMSRVGAGTSNAVNYGYQILMGLGSGAYVQAGFAVIQAVLPPNEAGNGLLLMLIAQLCGLAFSVSLAGTIFINFAVRDLAKALPSIPRSQIQGIVAGTSGNALSQLSTADRSLVLDIIVSAEQKVWTEVYAAAALAVVLSWFLSNRKAFAPTPAGGG